MTESVFSPLEVYARWAYSEIVDGALCHIYDHFDGVEGLRTKRKANVSFEQLSSDDLTRLASMCSVVRPDLQTYCAAVGAFGLAALTKAELGAVVVPPHIPPDRFHVWFSYFMLSRAGPGNVSPPIEDYKLPDAPLTLGRVQGHYVLVDGYRRAASFWRSAPAGSVIWAFVPV
jgi:hypothetical protein